MRLIVYNICIMNEVTSKEILYRWKPSIFIRVGATLNIVFCSILSMLVFTLPITIPAIVLNALLLFPVIDTQNKRKLLPKIIPCALTIFLASIIAIIIFLSITSIEGLLNWFINIINNYVFFWRKEATVDIVDFSFWSDLAIGIVVGLGIGGAVLVLLGWYSKSVIGEIDTYVDEKKNKKKSKK